VASENGSGETLWCPICRAVCRAGMVEGPDGGQPNRDLRCAFYHRKEGRCLVKMIEFDLFNVARALDVISNS